LLEQKENIESSGTYIKERQEMKAVVTKYGGVAGRLAGSMTRAQALRLKGLAEEAYQPEQFAADLNSDEAARRIDALKAEIALADSY
jgi:Protein of unknown function (DUF3072)